MYTAQPSIISGSFNTNAVAGTGTNHSIIPAPGANLKIRLRAIGFNLAQTEPAANFFQFRLLIRGTAFNALGVTLSTAIKADVFYEFDFPGLDVVGTTNLDAQIQSFCTAATRPFNYTAYYYIDDVN